MLTPPQPDTHVVLKLVTNEIILGKVKTSSTAAVELENPILINLVPVQQGDQVGLRVMPSDYFQRELIEDSRNLKTVVLKQEHIIHVFQASQNMVAMHTKLTSGLVLAPAGAEKNIKLVK